MQRARTSPLALVAGLGLLVWPGAAGAQPGAAQPDAAGPPTAEPRLIALVPAVDAARAIALGPHGEVYEPDGRGAWIRTRPIATANRLTSAARAGDEVVAVGDGVIFRLEDNGWSALRLHQRQRAVMSAGTRGVAAVGRQLFALERGRAGEPAKLGTGPAAVQMLGAGDAAVTIATERGLYRSTGGAFRPLPHAPRRVDRLISDRWALVARGAVDLDTGIVTAWPADTSIEAAGPGVAGTLVAVGRTGARLELLTLAPPSGASPRSVRTRDRRDRGASPPGAPVEGALQRETIPDGGTGIPSDAPTSSISLPGSPSSTEVRRGRADGATAVGVVVDARGGAVVALADGRLAVRERGAWRLVEVGAAMPPSRPGAAPARAP